MNNKEEKFKQVHLLREKTGLSLLDCKYALQHNNWEIDKSIKYLVNKDNSSKFTF